MAEEKFDPTKMVVNNVPVKEAWWSKINVAAILTPLVTLAAFAGYDISALTPELVAQVIGGIWALQNIAIIIFRTFFTSSLTVASAVKLVGTSTKKK